VARPGGPAEVFYPDPDPDPGYDLAAGPGGRGSFVPGGGPAADGPFVPGPSGPGSAGGPAAPDAATPTSGGGLALDAHASFAERASLQRQALAELSSISAYRPQATDPGAGSLTRRTPAATAAVVDAPEDAIVRDAEALRARLTAFRAGTARGSQAGAATDPLAVTDLTSVAEEAR